MDLKQILEQYRNGERGMPTYDELVTIADRAQADAKPVAWMYDDSNGPHLSFTPPSRFGSDQLSEMEVTVHALYTRALAATAAESECPRCGLTVSPESCDCAEARAAAQQQAEPSYAEIPADIAEALERTDWTPEEALRWYAACKHFDVVNGRTRILDTGSIASLALKRTSPEYHAMKGADASFPAPAAQQQAEPGAEERAAFEAWVTSDFGYTRSALARRWEGYEFKDINRAWEGWQARAAQSGQWVGVADKMVQRFLGWRLPDDFYPDCFVSFDSTKAKMNGGWPVGTNLLTAKQAKEMLSYALGVQYVETGVSKNPPVISNADTKRDPELRERINAAIAPQQAEPGAEERAGVAEEQRQRVRDAIAEALGDAYDCMRVWSAWGVGTMTQDDFQLVAEDDARVDEIASAAIGAMSAK
ncbi:hypothetical protein RSW36_25160 [Escherichia coli]|uniref:hypothetical protein n=1 Tax=Escherichia coli TaxID=562 RepID=UPI0028DD652A|nr:hypothetical protein [Escherichia coli]MDT9046442.1 hypothetical protein [Escherichia coli]